MTSDLPSLGALCAMHTQLHTQHPGSHEANAGLCALSNALCQTTQNLQLCLSQALSRLRHATVRFVCIESKESRRPAQACPWLTEALRHPTPFVRKSRLKGEHRHCDAMRRARNLCAASCWLCAFQIGKFGACEVWVAWAAAHPCSPQRISQASLDERRHHWVTEDRLPCANKTFASAPILHHCPVCLSASPSL